MSNIFILRVPAQYISGRCSEPEEKLGDRVVEHFTEAMKSIGSDFLVLPAIRDKTGFYIYDVEVQEIE